MKSPYLDGNFAPVTEEVTVDELPIIGELPVDLNGMFVRNGPNPQFPPDSGPHHWFDGDGMLHGIRLDEGKASYRNRYIRTSCFEHENTAGHAIWKGMTDSPTLRELVFPPHGIRMKNPANTALVWHDGRLLALWEQGAPHEISVPGLETVGPYTYGKKLTHAFTAHPKVDPVTGEMMFFGYKMFGRNKLFYSIVSPQGELVSTVPIHIPKAVMIHDFAITERYTIFMDLPLEFSLRDAMSGGSPFTFNKGRPARFGILPRHGTNRDVKWFESDPCFVFHNVNAFERGDEVVLVGCRMEETNVIAPPGHSTKQMGHSQVVEKASGKVNLAHLHQWCFNMTTGEMREAQLDDHVAEFPSFNEAYMGRPNRYAYTGHGTPPVVGEPQNFVGLLKYDLHTGRCTEHNFGRNRFGGEAVFVERPGASAEDDGWLITILHDEDESQSELVVVSAQEPDQDPVARILLPQRVPYGFHATWIDAV